MQSQAGVPRSGLIHQDLHRGVAGTGRAPQAIVSTADIAKGAQARFPGVSTPSTSRTMSRHHGELPREVLVEPYVTLSLLTSPIIHMQLYWLDASAQTDHDDQT
jgi:hypothetical protein